MAKPLDFHISSRTNLGSLVGIVQKCVKLLPLWYGSAKVVVRDIEYSKEIKN